MYKSQNGETEMLALYDRQLKRLGLEYEDRMVVTRFGATHVVIAGARDAPPVVAVHGGNGNTPLNLSLFRPLVAGHRVYAPDTIGHPGKSAQTRLSPSDGSYGKWLVDVLDGLGLESVPVVASSYGASIVLQTAAMAPQRVSGAALCVPSGIAHGPILPMMCRLVVPWMLYGLRPTRKRLLQAFAPMMTEVDEEFLEFTDAMLRHVKMELRGPRELSKKELSGFSSPTLVIAAQDDIFFPADRVLPRADEILPNLVVSESIAGKHLPSREMLRQMNEAIGLFLDKVGQGEATTRGASNKGIEQNARR
ncbi:MAG TPA: alpha/beta fold hydrolase [Terriglobales bacterium]|nr:alpha/beta fold hydrolase [Terriglobales bacterium]